MPDNHEVPAREDDTGESQGVFRLARQPKEFPILFSAPMVQALLADRKHVTRRLSKQWLKVKDGDRLWVRETFDLGSDSAGIPIMATAPNIGTLLKMHPSAPSGAESWCLDWKKHSSIHMPRWASRILLQVEEDAREEKLQEITEEEARLEGVEPEAMCDLRYSDTGQRLFSSYQVGFRNLWDSLHTKPGETWESNPEVVRVGRFRRIQ